MQKEYLHIKKGGYTGGNCKLTKRELEKAFAKMDKSGRTTGDNILVWKPTISPRIFNLFASMRNEQTDIYRIPSFSNIKRNDILVFNFPHPNNWDKIEMR